RLLRAAVMEAAELARPLLRRLTALTARTATTGAPRRRAPRPAAPSRGTDRSAFRRRASSELRDLVRPGPERARSSRRSGAPPRGRSPRLPAARP
ncbi:hypothetical protein H3147_14575, partial [Streptomyces sp. OF8]|nr:hypothetical protein [Streptomyces alkaliterrae]